MHSSLKTIFRYPGGKTKLTRNIIPQLRNSIGLDFFKMASFKFIDVFTGGGSVFLDVINEFPSAKIVINDLDEYIYSFWNTISCAKSLDKLIYYIRYFDPPTVESFNKLRQEIINKDMDESKKGFCALFFNRTTFSGIFRSGPIGGYEQEGNIK